ncbi:MAG: small-conductance mechanosensitive channel [Salibacteraceae bacterium]|jgi:small-conductance mechanosensitive channel
MKTVSFLVVAFFMISSFAGIKANYANVDSTIAINVQLYELTLQLKSISNTLESLKGTYIPDSIPVDSIKLNLTQKLVAEDTCWVVFQGDSLWPIYLSFGPDSPKFRTKTLISKLNLISFFKISNTFDSLSVKTENQEIQVLVRGELFFNVTANDAIILNTTPEELANFYIATLRGHSSAEALLNNNRDILWRIGKVFFVVFILISLVKFLNLGFRKTNRIIISFKGNKLKGLNIKGFEIINDAQVVKLSLFLARIFRLFVVLFLISMSLPIIFGLFPWTESLADTLIGYFLNPIQEYFWLFIHYIPNIISIFIISYIGHFILKFTRYLADEVENGNLIINGFYQDWAKPTFNLIRFGLYIIMLIFIFPFLPGSGSPIFKGVSVFVGILITMGSSSSVNNVVAGLVLTYMRPFKKGDRIKVDDILGFVTEKTMLVTRLRTSKQEIITIPNSKILNTNIINYSISIQENDGVVVHSTITIGYDVPWRKVHKALLKATEGIETISQDPIPFVLQTSLDDYYVAYEINAYVTNVKTIIGTQSKLHENIQDVFRDEGIEILSPHYRSYRSGEKITIPKIVKEDFTYKADQVDDHTPELDQQKEDEAEHLKETAKSKKEEPPKSFIDLIGKVTNEDSDKKNEKPINQLDKNSDNT